MTKALMRNATTIGAVLALPLLTLAALAAQPPKIVAPPTPEQAAHFENKVRPLLLKTCELCHGANGASGGLRLDQPITLEKAKLLLVRIKGDDGKDRMPLNGAPLSPQQIGELEKWVADGAPWPASSTPEVKKEPLGKNHWAFQPMKRPAVPTVKNKAWVRNPIDAFVLAKLEAKGLKPSPTATRRELLRRLSYDLVGLPPTPEEIKSFEADKDPSAYEKQVDRLLASPHYGEKWARHWLDLVRYAETNSYERDNPKPDVWRYRDYVIDAFNTDKPYTRFIQEQLAGDELPDGGNAGIVATGFYRLGIWDDEPTDREQARYDSLDDVVTTVGQTFLGLTLDCARCHDHKIDPIPQKDYYKFLAFFNGTNHFRNGGSTDERPLFKSAADRTAYDQKVLALEQRRNDAQAKITALEQEYAQKSVGSGASAATRDLDELSFRYYRDSFTKLPAFDTLKAETVGKVPSGLFDIKRLRDRDEAFGFVFEGMLIVPTTGRYTFYLDSDDGSRLTVGGTKVIEYDGVHGQGDEKSRQITLQAGRVPIRLDYFQGEAGVGLSVAWSGPGFRRRSLATPDSAGPEAKPAEIGADGGDVLGAARFQEYQQLKKDLEILKRQVVPVERALCITEMPQPLETNVLLRGSAAAKADKVEPGFPQIFGGGDAVLPKEPIRLAGASPEIAQTSGRRLALANWIASPSNRLTSRVLVNRVFQHHFGRGIVRSSNNYGLGGDLPTHPELLDYLGTEFSKPTAQGGMGWSIKTLHKRLLMSNTYKQSSRGNAAGLAKDPQNNLLWRFDMRRLTAEELRDSVLAVSGNLNLELGGPSVYPDIQQAVLQGQSIPGKDWYPDRMTEAQKNRRSVYIFVKRSLVFPLLESFDLAETDRTSPVRFATTQPTQALSTLNGPLMQKQARVFAERVKKETGDDLGAFVGRVIALSTQRTATEDDQLRGVMLIERLEKDGATPEQARAYFCLLALNLNEFIYLD